MIFFPGGSNLRTGERQVGSSLDLAVLLRGRVGFVFFLSAEISRNLWVCA